MRRIIKKIKGFTLAEVLITLGIIGVVAAMTIPTLYGSMQKRQTVAKLQKGISLINQAYKMSYNDNGDLLAEEIRNGIGMDNYFKTYWAPYIKAEVCETYQESGYNSVTPWNNLDGKNHTMYVVAKNARTTFITPDGMLFMVCVWGGEGVHTNVIYLDINGGTLPNVIGKDVFILDRKQNEYGVEIVPYGSDKNDATVNANCSKYGDLCAEKIKRAGWRIDASYPW